MSDSYHALLKAPWWLTFSVIAGVWLGLNVLFAAVYLAIGGVANARPGSFEDAFFFSVHTMATIGYGSMYPSTTTAHVVVTVEAFLGMLSIAMATGLIFSKFARPTARVLFSRVAVVTQHDGRRALLFRMANERANQIVEANLRVIVVRDEVTAEGVPLRRMHDLSLRRSSSPLFALTWLAIHDLDEKSPLHGATRESLVEQGVEIVVALVGFDDTFSQTVHARHSYLPEEVEFDAQFADILSATPDGRRQVDYGRFHEVIRPTER